MTTFQGRADAENARRRRRREVYLLDSVGGSGVQSGTMPVPSVNNQSDSTKEKVCNNNNIVESPKKKKKDDSNKRQEQQQQTPRKKEVDEKEDHQESGIDVEGDNVMQVRRVNCRIK